MSDLHKALNDIADIRSQLAAGTVFQGFGPLVFAISGALAFTLMFGQMVFAGTIAKDPQSVLIGWVLLAFVAACLIGYEARARSHRHHGGMADQMVMNAIEQFLPSVAAGGALFAIFYFVAPDDLWLLPGLWQLLVALGVFTALRMLPKTMALIGAWYFLAGVGTLLLAAQTETFTSIHMGVPFGVGQFLAAYLLYKAEVPENE